MQPCPTAATTSSQQSSSMGTRRAGCCRGNKPSHPSEDLHLTAGALLFSTAVAAHPSTPICHPLHSSPLFPSPTPIPFPPPRSTPTATARMEPVQHGAWSTTVTGYGCTTRPPPPPVGPLPRSLLHSGTRHVEEYLPGGKCTSGGEWAREQEGWSGECPRANVLPPAAPDTCGMRPRTRLRRRGARLADGPGTLSRGGCVGWRLTGQMNI